MKMWAGTTTEYTTELGIEGGWKVGSMEFTFRLRYVWIRLLGE